MDTKNKRDEVQVLPDVSQRSPLVTIESVPRTIRMYQVSDPELNTFLSSYNSIHGTFFGLAVGAAIMLAITLGTVHLSDRVFATFVALLAVSVVAGLYFGLRWKDDRDKAQRQAAAIKER